MTITFADGTKIEVATSVLDDFLRHDLKWVEFVHGRASTKQLSCNQPPPSAKPMNQPVHRCPSGGC